MQYPDLNPIMPEIILVTAALVILILELFIKRKDKEKRDHRLSINSKYCRGHVLYEGFIWHYF
jgi:NADH:ubiquinone oxidoreductase subunit 2 (subunit N)